MPVHQDGSCNGLQHYAALGRDMTGGFAVNLCPSDKPQVGGGVLLRCVVCCFVGGVMVSVLPVNPTRSRPTLPGFPIRTSFRDSSLVKTQCHAVL